MNKQDQEQHRLAALAAGYKAKKGASGRFFKWESSGNFDEWWQVWHPKTCKVDSFDLMVACSMFTGFTKKGNTAVAAHPYTDIECQKGVSETPANDLMQAIFDCAVEIGRLMETQDNEP